VLKLVEAAVNKNTSELARGSSGSTVAILYEQAVAAAGLLWLISDDFTVIGRYTDVHVMIDDVAARSRPDVLAIEIGASVTLETINKVVSSLPGVRIVLWVDTVSQEFVSNCLSLGVRGILSKRGSTESHVECFQKVARGEVWIDRTIQANLTPGKQIRLTPRERQLMSLLTQGLANKEIAWQLGISPGTVKVYLSKLFGKVGVSDRFELALMALRNIAPNEGRANLELFSSPACWMPATVVNVTPLRVA
jgi:DNA-binding NarL/FixJ family response regulator